MEFALDVRTILKRILKQEALGRTNSLISFDTTRTALKTKTLEDGTETAHCLATVTERHRQQSDLIDLKNHRKENKTTNGQKQMDAQSKII